MITFIQETDSKIVFPLSPNTSHSFPLRPVNETLGSIVETQFISLSRESNLIKQAWETVKRSEYHEVAVEAKKLLLKIQDVLNDFQQFQFDVGYIPQLKAFNVDDGSILLEWVCSTFRLGFTIEPIPEESGWYLVTNEELGEISASGFMPENNSNSLILWLLNFVFSHV